MRGPCSISGCMTVFASQVAVPVCCNARPRGRIPPRRKMIFQSIASYASSMVIQRPSTMATAPINAATRIDTTLNAARRMIDIKIVNALRARSFRRCSSVNSLVTTRSFDRIIRRTDSLSHCNKRVSPSSKSISARRSRRILPRRCMARTMQPKRRM